MDTLPLENVLADPGSNPALDKLAYSIESAASVIGICRALVYRQIASGALPARKFGRRTVILRSDLVAFLDSLPRAEAMS